jgi:hypothetical protein
MPPPGPTEYDQQQDEQDRQRDEQARQRDEQARQRDQQQDSRISNLQNRLTGVESDVVQQGGQAATLQRFRIHIPNPHTHFLLGQRLTTGTPFGYTGASLQTDGNLFIDIAQNTVVQTAGFTTLQTNAGWQQYAASLMEMSSPVAVKVVGGQVFIGATGTVEGPITNRPKHGETLSANVATDLTEAISHLTTVSTAYDIGLSTLSLIATGLFFTPLDMADFHNKVKTLETAASTAYKLYKLGEKIYKVASGPTPKKDVNIYGKDGVNVMSPKTVMLTAESSIKAFAHEGVTIGSMLSSSVTGVQGVKCFGGVKASLEGGAYADVKAGAELGVSCLRGKLKLKGKEIEVGSDTPKWTQLATSKLTLLATTDLLIGRSKKGKPGAEVEKIVTETVKLGAKKKIEIESQEDYELKAAKNVKIHVGNYAIDITKDHIKIGKGGDGKPTDPLITVKGEKIILDSSGMAVKVSKKSITMGKGDNIVSVSSSGNLTVKGKKVKLG